VVVQLLPTPGVSQYFPCFELVVSPSVRLNRKGITPQIDCLSMQMINRFIAMDERLASLYVQALTWLRLS
jgi:hypothetical protein